MIDDASRVEPGEVNASEEDTVATPEGDNETPPDAPLGGVPAGLQRTPTDDTNTL